MTMRTQRLNPSTSKAVTDVVEQLMRIADDIEPARPHLPALYRSLAEAIDYSIHPADETTLRIKLPKGSVVSCVGREVKTVRDTTSLEIRVDAE